MDRPPPRFGLAACLLAARCIGPASPCTATGMARCALVATQQRTAIAARPSVLIHRRRLHPPPWSPRCSRERSVLLSPAKPIQLICAIAAMTFHRMSLCPAKSPYAAGTGPGAPTSSLGWLTWKARHAYCRLRHQCSGRMGALARAENSWVTPLPVQPDHAHASRSQMVAMTALGPGLRRTAHGEFNEKLVQHLENRPGSAALVVTSLRPHYRATQHDSARSP